MEYVTHKKADGTFQELIEHLTGVSKRAATFAEGFGAEEHARRTGMLHDIGKYSPAAQQRQRDPEHTAKIDHATAGAQEARRLGDIAGAFAIAGHHGGLPDPGTRLSVDASTLFARLNKSLTGKMDPSNWRSEQDPITGDVLPVWFKQVPRPRMGFVNAMYTRMLFSCLVDADYLDTEAFMTYEEVERDRGEALSVLLEKLRSYVEPWLAVEGAGLNRIRSDLLRACLQGGEREQGLYTMTIPTGGGKTVSSLAFALSHAMQHGMKRVIYVVPYTSIIEQNAEVFRQILGEENVLEHHANVDMDDEENNLHRLAAENWNSPVVVTTAVQFFESLFAAKPSRCRKLHNITNAVVIFDEVQMLPVPYLRPCVNAIAELVQHYGATAVLCTATQPALEGVLTQYAPELKTKEICSGPSVLFEAFRRTKIVRDGVQTQVELATRLAENEQVLCIVNLRRTAQEIFGLLPEEGRFHLSTLMTPEHRMRKLDEIRQRLKAGLPCRVVSTSLIEAGVDVDFPEVWRELAGLDSILQAAGRCNREGKRPMENSLVHVFHLEGAAPRMIRQNVAATERVVAEFADIAASDAIETYFRELFYVLKSNDALDAKGIMRMSDGQQFRTIAKEFKLIEEETVPVYIPAPENAHLLVWLRAGEVSRELLRKLGRYAVNVRPAQLTALLPALEMQNGFAILLDAGKYDENCGLSLEGTGQDVWIC